MATRHDVSVSAIPGLTDRLKQRTWALHREAERSGVIHALLLGTVSRLRYAALLRNLVPVYDALESALEALEPSALRNALARPELYRAVALRNDLRSLAGPRWSETLPLLPAARRYADQITTASQGIGERLLAHAYVRYMGDLNGGRVLKRAVHQHLALRDDALAFYDFATIVDIPAYLKGFRATLDDTLLLGVLNDTVEEAARAFQCNIDLSDALIQVDEGCFSDAA